MPPRSETTPPLLTPHEALVFAMVFVSAADRDMTDNELRTIGRIVGAMPAFAGFDLQALPAVADRCVTVLQEAKGLEDALAMIAAALSPALRETAYAFACDVVAADARAGQEELRALELMRHRLDVERLVAAAIERGAGARHARLP